MRVSFNRNTTGRGWIKHAFLSFLFLDAKIHPLKREKGHWDFIRCRLTLYSSSLTDGEKNHVKQCLMSATRGSDIFNKFGYFVKDEFKLII